MDNQEIQTIRKQVGGELDKDTVRSDLEFFDSKLLEIHEILKVIHNKMEKIYESLD